MLFHRNPLERGLTGQQIVCLALYLIFFSASVWATAESIARTTQLPRLYCYIISFAFLAGASFCLGLIKKSLSTGYVAARTTLLIIGIIGFLFLWLVSLTSNTHNFYFVSAVDDLRRSELREALGRLQLLRTKTELAAQAAAGALRQEIEGKIERMKSEILNPGNLGPGPETERVIAEIENLLQQEIQPLDLPRGGGLASYRRYSDAMAAQIRGLLNTRLAEIDESLRGVGEYLDQPELGQLVSRLKNAQEGGVSSMQIDPLKDLLRSAYKKYNESLEVISEAFRQPSLLGVAPSFEALPDVPDSIRLENIAAAWRDFLKGIFEPWKFWLSFLWAIALDLAAFVLFYFGVLPRDEYL